MARVKQTGFAAALESAAKHSKKYKRGHRAFERASRAAKKGWKTRRKRKPLSIAEVAEAQGVRAAIETARGLGVHPDSWARDITDDFDLESMSVLYDEYFGYGAAEGF